MSEHVAVDEMPAGRRWSRTTSVLVSMLAVGALLLVGAYVWLGMEAESKLREALAEADRLDPQWDLDSLEEKRIKVLAEENSVETVMTAKGLIPVRWPFWDDGSGTSPDSRLTSEDLDALRKAFQDRSPHFLLTPAETSHLRAELGKVAKALSEARKLADMPRGRNPIRYSEDGISTLLPYTQEGRLVANLLEYDVRLRVQEGDLEGAMSSTLGILNIQRAIGDEPTLVSMLVRVAIRAVALKQIQLMLAQGELSPASLEKLQKELEQESQQQLLLVGARGERALMDRMMIAIQNGKLSYKNAAQLISSGPGAREMLGVSLDELEMRFMAGSLTTSRAALLHFNNQFVEIAKLPAHQRHERMRELDDSVAEQPRFVQAIAPAVFKVATADQRGQAKLQCAITIIAAERFRLAEGRWPESLAELVPRYLKEVPLDPFDGSPLRLIKLEDGLVIYSIGTDKSDNGGNLQEYGDKVGTDLGYRLWNVDKRRQPPPPPPPLPGEEPLIP